MKGGEATECEDSPSTFFLLLVMRVADTGYDELRYDDDMISGARWKRSLAPLWSASHLSVFYLSWIAAQEERTGPD